MNAIVREFRNNDNCCYFDRTPERLVLEGYRRWTAGYQNNSVVAWELAWRLYDRILGEENAKRALIELWQFIRTVGHCSTCPLRYFPSGAHHLCRDECLILGLVAGAQHGDDLAVGRCLTLLACPAKSESIAMAAGSFALTLKGMDQLLLPIPISVIDDIGARQIDNTLH